MVNDLSFISAEKRQDINMQRAMIPQAAKIVLPADEYEKTILQDAVNIFQHHLRNAEPIHSGHIFRNSNWAGYVAEMLAVTVIDTTRETESSASVQSLGLGSCFDHQFHELINESTVFRHRLFDSVNQNIVQTFSCLLEYWRDVLRDQPNAEDVWLKNKIFSEGLFHREIDSEHWNKLNHIVEWTRSRNETSSAPHDNLASHESIGNLQLRPTKTWRLIRDFSIACRRGKHNLSQVRNFVHSCCDKKIDLTSVPFTSLEFIPAEELHEFGELDHPDQDLFKSERKMYWTPRERSHFDYLLYTEEDVYRYCVMENYYFPGFLKGGHPVFVVKDLKDSSDFTKFNYGHLSFYNDCAITRLPGPDGEWKVLETIPGIQYRKFTLENTLLPSALGRQIFRRLCERRQLKTSDLLREYMGELYDKNLDRFLSAIPFEDINPFTHNEIFTDIDPSTGKKLGSGARADVYFAIWNQHSSVTRLQDKALPVALKCFPASKDTKERQEKSMMNELEMACKLQYEGSVGVSKFYGLTKSPPALGNTSFPTNTIFLVFEYATMKTLDDYLPNLTGDESDWQFIFRTVYDVSCGLASIHEQGIVHTDMHRQNLLVTFDQTEGAVTVHVADLGEARHTANSSSLLVRESFCSTAIIPYHIDIFTPEGDMLRLASLIERMSLKHWEMKGDQLSQKLIPKTLQDFLNKCRSPEDIPSSYQLAQDMDDERDEMWTRQRLWEIVDVDDPTTEVLEFDMVVYRSFCEK